MLTISSRQFHSERYARGFQHWCWFRWTIWSTWFGSACLHRVDDFQRFLVIHCKVSRLVICTTSTNNLQMPLAGAYVADTYWGRFKTIQVACGVAIIGHIILIISAIPPVIVHPNSAIACFSIGIIIMGMGVGGFKSNISPLIAEQCKLRETGR